VEKLIKESSIKDMTVCIAAIADKGKKLVIASDNMITLNIGGTISYQKEDAAHKKIIQLNENVYALFAGRLDTMNPLVAKAKEVIKTNTSASKAAQLLRDQLHEFAQQKIEEEILSRAGMDWNVFKNKQTQLNPEILKDVYNKVVNFAFDIQIIVAGYETPEKPFLGLILGNGTLLDHTLSGALTCGGGGELAKFSLIVSDYNQLLSAEDVESKVRKALADASRAPGVGSLGELIVFP
jgi:hypothetical protein